MSYEDIKPVGKRVIYTIEVGWEAEDLLSLDRDLLDIMREYGYARIVGVRVDDSPEATK